jgi:hypothetical protein
VSEAANNPSCLTKLRDVLGADIEAHHVPALSESERATIEHVVREWMTNWRLPMPSPKELRIAVPEATNVEVLNELSLFAHRIIMRDPLEQWFTETSFWRTALPKREPPPSLAQAVRISRAFAECVNAGFVIFAPRRADYWTGGGLDAYKARQSMAYVKSVLGDAPEAPWHAAVDWSGWTGDPATTLDHDLLLMQEMDSDDPYFYDDQVRMVQNDSYARAARLALARQAAANFVPLDQSDDLFLRAVVSAEAGAERDLVVTTLLRDVRFPLLDGMRPREAAKIRESSEAFSAWREWLADLMLEAVSVEAVTGLDAGERAAEKLRLAAQEARAAVSRSRALSQYFIREAPVSVSAVVLAGSVFGPKAALGSGLGAAVRGAWSVLRPDQPSAAQGVLVRLLRDRSE